MRAKIFGTKNVPRVSVFKSNKNIFVQFIDDEKGRTLLSGKGTVVSKDAAQKTKTERSAAIGETLAKEAVKAGIKKIVFDRGGFKYQGRIKALADGLRKGGLQF